MNRFWFSLWPTDWLQTDLQNHSIPLLVPRGNTICDFFKEVKVLQHTIMHSQLSTAIVSWSLVENYKAQNFLYLSSMVDTVLLTVWIGSFSPMHRALGSFDWGFIDAVFGPLRLTLFLRKFHSLNSSSWWDQMKICLIAECCVLWHTLAASVDEDNLEYQWLIFSIFKKVLGRMVWCDGLYGMPQRP